MTVPSFTQVGGLKWYKYSGVGSVTGGTDGTGTYDAGASAGNVNLFLRVESGPCRAYNKDYYKTVVAPNGGYMIQKPGSGIRHTVNTSSVGFLGISYITPKSVSFTNLQTREGTCKGIASGFWAYLNGQVHQTGSWNGVDDGNINTGCKEDYPQDEVWSGEKGPPYSIGDFTWPIPIEYKADDGVVHTLTQNQNQHHESDVNGKCTISKYGSVPFSKNASEQTSGW